MGMDVFLSIMYIALFIYTAFVLFELNKVCKENDVLTRKLYEYELKEKYERKDN